MPDISAGIRSASARLTKDNLRSFTVSGAVESGDSTGYLYFGTRTGGSITEKARIDSDGRLLVGTSSARTNFFNGSISGALQAEGTTYDTTVISSTINSTSSDPIITLARSRGTSVGSNTIVQSGDTLGRLIFQGSDGTEFVQAASIGCDSDGTPGANDMPGRLVFSTTADGASSPTERLRITSDGKLGLGTDNPSAQAEIQTAGLATTTNLTLSNSLQTTQ